MAEADSLKDLLDTVFSDMRAFGDEQTGTETGAFVISDPAAANWCLEHLRALNREGQADAKTAERILYDVKTWLDGRTAEREKSIAYFEALLREWHDHRLEEDPELKTITLPAGEIQYKAMPDKFERDEARILDWLLEQGITNYAKGLDWSGFKKEVSVKDGKAYYKPTGELVPSVAIVDQGDEHYVRPAK